MQCIIQTFLPVRWTLCMFHELVQHGQAVSTMKNEKKNLDRVRGQQRRHHTEVDLKIRIKGERRWWLWAGEEKYEVLRRWEKLRLQQRWRSRGLPCDCLMDLCTTCITIHSLIGALYLTHSSDACNSVTKWIKSEGIYPSGVAFMATNTCLFCMFLLRKSIPFITSKAPLKGCWNYLVYMLDLFQHISVVHHVLLSDVAMQQESLSCGISSTFER